MTELERIRQIERKKGYVYNKTRYDYIVHKWFYVFADFRDGDYVEWKSIEVHDKDLIEKLNDKEHICCICGNCYGEHGNNAEPIVENGICCDKCNEEVVVPYRVKLYKECELYRDDKDR